LSLRCAAALLARASAESAVAALVLLLLVSATGTVLTAQGVPVTRTIAADAPPPRASACVLGPARAARWSMPAPTCRPSVRRVAGIVRRSVGEHTLPLTRGP
jgi:hypothetical protein